MPAIQLSLFPEENIITKYQSLPTNIFGFEIFDDVLKVINERQRHEPCEFNSGVASADAAVRRLREKYYETITQSLKEAE